MVLLFLSESHQHYVCVHIQHICACVPCAFSFFFFFWRPGFRRHTRALPPFCLCLTVLLSVCPPRGANPLDHRDNSFSRSRSSSVTSIDKESRESISSFHFCDAFVRKGDCALTPCLYVGTSLGTVLAVALTLPPAGEQRQLQPVIVSPSGERFLQGGGPPFRRGA